MQAVRALAWVTGISSLLLAGAQVGEARDLADMNNAEITVLQQRLTDGGCYRGAIDGRASAALQDAIKACPQQDPVLRIETGTHVAKLSRIGVDKACRIAATASDDKTVRIWSLPDGRLLQTLRMPLGDEDAGKAIAVAVSPDGRYVVSGGYDGRGDPVENYVHVFEAATGRFLGNVGTFGENVSHLAFSLDGRWLAATGGGKVGLKVIDTQTWRVVAEDTAYGNDTYGAAFAPDGRLYTASWDGRVRQYSPAPDFRKEREVKARGNMPYSVAIDPSGQLVAIGFSDQTKLEIYEAGTLRLHANADTRGVDYGDLTGVAWTNDGSVLGAGGDFRVRGQGGWQHPLLLYNRDGRRLGGILLGEDAILSVQPCGAGFAVGEYDAAFGLVDGNGQVILWKTSVAPAMREKTGGAFTISADAKQVRFGLNTGSDDAVLFDLAQGTLTEAHRPTPGLFSANVNGPISGWQDTGHPTFAGKRIKLDNDEFARSLAVRPDRTGFVLGAEWSVRAYDAHGTELWNWTGPAAATGANISADGRIVVMAHLDGTVRWRRWSDGKELLALFVNSKTKQWVAWTPTGYYMASTGGEDLIGWHLNRGWDQLADFFPASRFRDRFNRPDIIHLALDTLDEDAAIKQANAASNRKEDTRPLTAHLPPIIRIADPANGAHVASGTVTLNYSLRSPSGQPVERIDVLIDGRPVKAVGLPLHPMAADTETKGSISVTLTQRLTEVGLIAWNSGLASEAARIRLNWDGAPAPVEATRKLHALVVGVSNYVEPDMALSYAAKDARDFAKALQDQKGGYYTDVETRILTDRQVTRSSVIEGLAWLEKSAKSPDDVSVLFLAGHGLTDEKQTYWFFPSDANADDVHAKGVSQDEVRKSLQNLSGKVLWFLDTCHAGSAAKRRSVDVNVLVNTVSSSENGGIVVFASSTGRQVSVERDDWGNGAFTKAIVEGIELGKADLLGKGFITTSSLDTFVESRVAELTEGKQSPVMERPPQQPDFAIAEAHKR
jgi:WD40 repeat protein